MTITIISLILSSFFPREQSDLPAWAKERFKKFEKDYILGSFINPTFLQADFSGDKKGDVAILVERMKDKKKGILILFGERDASFVIGSGSEFSYAGDNFEWADTWGIFTETKTYETTFKENGDVDGGRKIKLVRPAITIRDDDGAGGLIYFDGVKFIWIHQGV